MKIICIEYKAEQVMFYTKPDTALYLHKQPFFLPKISSEFTCTMQLIVKIDRVGKSISEKFASRYYSEIGMGINLIASDVNRSTINSMYNNERLFDNSTIPSAFIKVEDNVEISFSLNNQMVDKVQVTDILNYINKTISEVSKFVTFKIGDLLVINVSREERKINERDVIEGYINDNKLLDITVN